MPAPKAGAKPKQPRQAAANNGQSQVRLNSGLASTAHSNITSIVNEIIKESDIEPRTRQDFDPASDGLVPDGESGWAPLEWFALRPDNPRYQDDYDEDDEDLKALADGAKAIGILQSILVCSDQAWLEHNPNDVLPPDVKAVVILGNRRLTASRLRGLDGLPYRREDKLAIPRNAREAGLQENSHRTGGNPVLEGRDMDLIMQETGETKRQFADRMGFSHTHVNNRTSLLKLIDEFQRLVSAGKAKDKGKGRLTADSALPIARLTKEQQHALLELGPPYLPARLDRKPVEDIDGGKTLSTTSAVRIPKRSTPADIARVLRDKLPPELLAEVRKLLDAETAAEPAA
ncbi:ParB/RepB/Spo0J family partition protein [Nocardia sp. NPDC052566]|uniref:ParB/RepB/Spo0J family partition protein n=1 Tax=Nocardia sp. NPDC052566 TaxID=3364330 RepID=UPI0037C74F21